MNLYKLQKALNEICKILERNYFINEGGCCLVASIIAYHLDKLGVEYNLLIFSDYKKSLRNIRKEILSKTSNKSCHTSVVKQGTCSHYAIQLKKGVTINADGYSGKRYSINGINFTHIKWIYKMGYWNPEYNIRNNKAIYKIFNNFFDTYL